VTLTYTDTPYFQKLKKVKTLQMPIWK